MAYMIYQQYTTAILEAYAGSPDLARHAQSAAMCRAWLESLAIDAQLRDPLVEQIAVLQEAFEDLLRRQ